MSSRDITLWIDERWYDALERHLAGGNLQEKMEETLDELINETIPEHEHKRIGAEIARERAELEQEREANRRLAVFRVTEHGEQKCFLVDEPIEFLNAARSLRSYIRAEGSTAGFRYYYAAAQDISSQEFSRYALERTENTGRVVGAFDIDLDRGEFAALNITDGWRSYSVKDVCTAAYHADLRNDESPAERMERLLGHLNGKELPTQTQPPPTMAMEQTM